MSIAQATPSGHGQDGLMAFRFEPRGTMRASCQTLDEAINVLRGEIQAAATTEIPECTSSELTLSLDASISLLRPKIGPYADGNEQDLPPDFKRSWSSNTLISLQEPQPQATVESIVSIEAGLRRQIVQRAASRGVVAAIEQLDGFKYSFNNAWAAKDDDGQRFSYICQDSMQNKDRHANGFTRTQKHLKGEGERGVRKPTFDCKGSVSVKFSLNKRHVEIYYRHYAIHPTLQLRKAAPMRHPAGAGSPEVDVDQRDSMSNTGGLFGKLVSEMKSASRSSAPSVTHPPARTAVPAGSRSLKRKHEAMHRDRLADAESSLPLADLLKISDAAQKASQQSLANDYSETPSQQAVTYDLPSWRAPLAPPSVPGPAPSSQSVAQRRAATTKPSPTLHQVPNQFDGSAAFRQPPQPAFHHPPPQPQPLHRPTYQQQEQDLQNAISQTQHPPSLLDQEPQPLHTISQHSSPHLQQQFASFANLQNQPLIPFPQQHTGRNTIPRQQGQGAPQGLFTTLKAVPVAAATNALFETHVGGRGRVSCSNCRAGKRKCDESRPICGSCQKTGKYDCSYENNVAFPFSGPAMPPWPMYVGGFPSADGSGQLSEHIVPGNATWFPKR